MWVLSFVTHYMLRLKRHLQSEQSTLSYTKVCPWAEIISSWTLIKPRKTCVLNFTDLPTVYPRINANSYADSIKIFEQRQKQGCCVCASCFYYEPWQLTVVKQHLSSEVIEVKYISGRFRPFIKLSMCKPDYIHHSKFTLTDPIPNGMCTNAPTTHMVKRVSHHIVRYF